MKTILSSASASITEFKRNLGAVIVVAADEMLTILRYNKPFAYLVPAASYERRMDRLQDLELAALVRARASERRSSLTTSRIRAAQNGHLAPRYGALDKCHRLRNVAKRQEALDVGHIVTDMVAMW